MVRGGCISNLFKDIAVTSDSRISPDKEPKAHLENTSSRVGNESYSRRYLTPWSQNPFRSDHPMKFLPIAAFRLLKSITNFPTFASFTPQRPSPVIVGHPLSNNVRPPSLQQYCSSPPCASKTPEIVCEMVHELGRYCPQGRCPDLCWRHWYIPSPVPSVCAGHSFRGMVD